MYSCGFIAACVYLANFREVRSLTAERIISGKRRRKGGWRKMTLMRPLGSPKD